MGANFGERVELRRGGWNMRAGAVLAQSEGGGAAHKRGLFGALRRQEARLAYVSGDRVATIWPSSRTIYITMQRKSPRLSTGASSSSAGASSSAAGATPLAAAAASAQGTPPTAPSANQQPLRGVPRAPPPLEPASDSEDEDDTPLFELESRSAWRARTRGSSAQAEQPLPYVAPWDKRRRDPAPHLDLDHVPPPVEMPGGNGRKKFRPWIVLWLVGFIFHENFVCATLQSRARRAALTRAAPAAGAQRRDGKSARPVRLRRPGDRRLRRQGRRDSRHGLDGRRVEGELRQVGHEAADRQTRRRAVGVRTVERIGRWSARAQDPASDPATVARRRYLDDAQGRLAFHLAIQETTLGQKPGCAAPHPTPPQPPHFVHRSRSRPPAHSGCDKRIEASLRRTHDNPFLGRMLETRCSSTPTRTRASSSPSRRTRRRRAAARARGSSSSRRSSRSTRTRTRRCSMTRSPPSSRGARCAPREARSRSPARPLTPPPPPPAADALALDLDRDQHVVGRRLPPRQLLRAEESPRQEPRPHAPPLCAGASPPAPGRALDAPPEHTSRPPPLRTLRATGRRRRGVSTPRSRRTRSTSRRWRARRGRSTTPPSPTRTRRACSSRTRPSSGRTTTTRRRRGSPTTTATTPSSAG